MQNFVIQILNAAMRPHCYEHTMGRAEFKTSVFLAVKTLKISFFWDVMCRSASSSDVSKGQAVTYCLTLKMTSLRSSAPSAETDTKF